MSTNDEDKIRPNEIMHECDVMPGDGLVYNYIDYHFDLGDRYFRARTYVHDMRSVAIYGPLASRGSVEQREGRIDEAVLDYFKRRFRTIQTLGRDGYRTIWSA
jgi:hypothetical protein